MKKLLKNTLPFVLLITAVLIIGAGCGDGLSPTPSGDICDNADTTIETALSDLSNKSMDLQVHEYVFTTSEPGSICAIGYQSFAQTTPYAVDNSAVSYEIEIVGGPTISSTFSNSSIEYISLTTPYEIVPGVNYTIKRTGGDGLNTSNGHTAAVTFPFASSNFTFVSSNFVDSGSNGGGPVANNGIPKIYFTFTTD
ncbi:hypothetical protein [Polaribacter sp. HaHaR_3_91]|jgi:hypothetical protein|uniref:hypothetical protein n=1 Tax=Polaribacter sp. HaHaR_3_91 TaxID=2745561 RepID=UPI001C4FC3B5|nr:hypothetical protein [Polaribacter sp. HaHaR_3_91]QXP64783.1 hypothetical protein H0I27_06305 [Polaribacter sp. HaHaR_3_91]